MTHLVIQPSYGNRHAIRHWKDTLAQAVPFSDPTYTAHLTQDQLDRLRTMHPEGSARFWGATGNHDTRMDRLDTGDVVLFTGQKIVRAIGEVGISFRNQAFADAMWSPDTDRGSFRNVYSLRAFQDAEIPYEEIWQLPGFKPGDNFMGLRIITGERADAILDGLNITTLTASTDYEARLLYRLETQQQTPPTTSPRTPRGVIGPEAINVETFTYSQRQRDITARRGEAKLLQAYLASTGQQPHRLHVPGGTADAFIPETGELIEAKGTARREHVRLAIGQLLDYAMHNTTIKQLTALFPERPNDHSLTLLHQYGINCVYLTDTDDFHRDNAPNDRRNLILGITSTAATLPAPPDQGRRTTETREPDSQSPKHDPVGSAEYTTDEDDSDDPPAASIAPRKPRQ